MADRTTELLFVTCYWTACMSKVPGDDQLAWRASSLVGSEMLQDAEIRKTFEYLRLRYAEGLDMAEDLVLSDLTGAQVPLDVFLELTSAFTSVAQLLGFATRIANDYRVRELGGTFTKALHALEHGKGARDGGKAISERVALRGMQLYTESGNGAFQSKAQQVADGKTRAMSGGANGIVLPWPKLEKACGPWVPGEAIGISAYSNAGKSTFAANLFLHFVRRGYPCIGFPTEMGAQWLDRVVAISAGVEQWRAEKQKWHGAEEQRDRYMAAYDDMEKLDWTMVNRAQVKPQEIVTASRILRKRWAGQPVVVFVDHMHRLDYGSDEPDKQAGAATQMLKNLAKDDHEGGMIVVMLYQPRKPSMGATQYGPIAGHQIRGHSSIWNELDVHISPFRMWVKTSEMNGKTAWGSVACDYEQGKPMPKLAKPESDGSKLDDEHVYIKVDKRRVGGEGPTVMLHFDAPSGGVWEMSEFTHSTEYAA